MAADNPITHDAAEEALSILKLGRDVGNRQVALLWAYITQNRETVPVSREDATVILRSFIVQNEDDVAVFDRLSQALRVKS